MVSLFIWLGVVLLGGYVIGLLSGKIPVPAPFQEGSLIFIFAVLIISIALAIWYK